MERVPYILSSTKRHLKIEPAFGEYYEEAKSIQMVMQASDQGEHKKVMEKYEEALNEVAFVRGSDLRIGEFWDDAAKEAEKLEKQIRDG